MRTAWLAARRRCSWRTVRAKLSPPKTSCVARGAGCNARHRPASLLSDENCHLLLSSCGFCCSSTLCLGFRTCACTFDPQIRLLGWSPLTRPGSAARAFHVPGPPKTASGVRACIMQARNYATHQRVGQREQASAGHDNLRGASQLRTGRRLAPTTRPERPHLALGSLRKKTS